jgi:hypothetical protein
VEGTSFDARVKAWMDVTSSSGPMRPLTYPVGDICLPVMA